MRVARKQDVCVLGEGIRFDQGSQSGLANEVANGDA
jgi:hypothetical protein